MELTDQKKFISQIAPFDTLDNQLLEELCNSLDIVNFDAEQIIYKEGEKPEYLYFIIQGVIQEVDEDEILSVYSSNEIFDTVSLIENKIKHNFLSKHDSVCFSMPRKKFLEIMYSNESLESYFFQSISDKLNNSIKNEQNKELVNFMMAKVSDAYLQKPIFVNENDSIYKVVELLKKENSAAAIVQSKDGFGIVTDTDFRDKMVLNRISYDAPVKEISTFGLKTIQQDLFLFHAQFTMNKYKIKRLVVVEDDNIIGILDMISLTSFFASHTYSIVMEVDNATTIEELKSASQKFIRVVRVLHAKGVKVRYISNIIGQLNNKLFNKLFDLIVPDQLRNKSALIIMGSEGRGEQILRTDQDNALIIADDCEATRDTIDKFTQQFTNHLVDFGYPRCQGNIMVSNPFWTKSSSEFEKTLHEWINSLNLENLMNLAIFYDALCVAGDKYLLIQLKEYLSQIATNSRMFHSFFAKPVLNFTTPLGIFSNFVVDKKEHKNELDIKKGGIFPIVHGVRALSLEKKIRKTNTAHRIKELRDLNVLEYDFASQLIESFNFLLTLRLKFRLEKIDAIEPLDNYINPDKLNPIDRDLLRDTFKIVDKFKKIVAYHFDLNRLG
jgi:CBS domain-containing protein